jgi:hypothetical protein
LTSGQTQTARVNGRRPEGPTRQPPARTLLATKRPRPAAEHPKTRRHLKGDFDQLSNGRCRASRPRQGPVPATGRILVKSCPRQGGARPVPAGWSWAVFQLDMAITSLSPTDLPERLRPGGSWSWAVFQLGLEVCATWPCLGAKAGLCRCGACWKWTILMLGCWAASCT